jgi:hypothetical protein
MNLTRYESAAKFLEHTEEYLLANETFNSLPLGISYAVRKNPQVFGSVTPYFSAVDHEGNLEAIAVRTPPYDLLIFSENLQPRDAFSLIAQDMMQLDPTLGGVNGRLELSELFAQIWCELTELKFTRQMHSRAYELKSVTRPENIDGSMRLATDQDIDLVVEWMNAFDDEAVPDDPKTNRMARVRGAVENENFFLWEFNGSAVSIAAKARPVVNGITVNSVYTPPDLRRKGYATALVAALSQHLLDEGWKFCTLFTDMKNPTSNSIYQKIGYEPIGDYANHRFE